MQRMFQFIWCIFCLSQINSQVIIYNEPMNATSGWSYGSAKNSVIFPDNSTQCDVINAPYGCLSIGGGHFGNIGTGYAEKRFDTEGYSDVYMSFYVVSSIQAMNRSYIVYHYPDSNLNISTNITLSLNNVAQKNINFPNVDENETLWNASQNMLLRFQMHSNTLNTDRIWISNVQIYGIKQPTMSPTMQPTHAPTAICNQMYLDSDDKQILNGLYNKTVVISNDRPQWTQIYCSEPPNICNISAQISWSAGAWIISHQQLIQSLRYITNAYEPPHSHIDKWTVGSTSETNQIEIVCLTSNPTIHPTNQPTVATNYPTNYPTNYITTGSIFSTLTASLDTNGTIYEQAIGDSIKKSIQLSFVESILICMSLLFLLVIIISYIYNRCIKVNDYYKVSALIAAFIQIMDMTSDVFFTIQITLHSKFSLFNSTLFLMFILSVSFIAVPVCLSIIQLHRQINKHWMKMDHARIWFTDNLKVLYFISILCGSAFSATNLCSSNLIDYQLFDIPLTKNQLLSFKYKRVYSTILLENLPQLLLQTYYISYTTSNGALLNPMVVISMTLSFISIIIAVITMITTKKILYSQNSLNISFEVVANGNAMITNWKQLRNQTRNIKDELSVVLGINSALIEISRPTQIPNGILLNLHIFINKTKSIDMNYQKIMNNAKQNGQIALIIQQCWKLSSIPSVNNIICKQNASKQQNKNTVIITHSELENNIEMNCIATVNLQKSIQQEMAAIIPNVKVTDMGPSNINNYDDLSRDSQDSLNNVQTVGVTNGEY